MSGQIDIKQSLKKAYRKQRPTRAEIELLRRELVKMLGEANLNESEEYHKGLLKDFLKENAYADYFINTKDRSDLVIHNGKNSKSSVGVIIETKRPSNKTEMPTTDNLNKKAMQELLLYFLRERVTEKNFDVKHLIATNLYEWFIFDAHEFEKIAEAAKLKKRFKDFEEGRLSFEKTELFYKEIAGPALEDAKDKITFTHFNILDYKKHLKKQTKTSENKLIELQKILSPTHLLKLPFVNDSNTLNKEFYSELLHIIGLEEYKEKGKKLIRRKEPENRNEDSLIEAAITQIICLDKVSRITDVERFGDNVDEQLYNIGLELAITWMNRVLFLKLLESQIVSYHESKDYLFLDIEKVPEYDDLNTLFFQVLAVEKKNRPKAIQEKYPNVPYLNSSLFEPTELEQQTIFISNLPNDTSLPLYKKTVVKSNNKKMNALEYFLRFLDTYDFSSEGNEEIAEENKTLINASVLGLIFEKINGYKDGSFFTPGFITMYMCRETIPRAVVQKFKEQTDFDSNDFGDLVNFTTGTYKKGELEKYNEIVNSMKICDPAVGSGHFLVSALNEIIAIKAELGILTDDSSKPIRDYLIDVENDELMILDGNGDFFKYDPKNREAQRVQETVFNEKQTIIENCLFGVDINPNSVKICRLRLWIELLKNAYYKADGELETLPNIDINIKCGNSLISRYPIDADLGYALVGSTWDIGTYRLAVMNYRKAENKEQKRVAEKLIKKIKSDFHIGITENEPIKKKRKKIKEELNDLTSQGRLFGKNAFKKDKKIVKRIEKLGKDIAELDAKIEDIKSGAVYRNAFEWRFEFPEVLDEKTGNFTGFDIIISNPPWGAKLDSNSKLYLKDRYENIDSSTPNTFAYFIGLVNKIGNMFVSQVLPDSILVKDFERTRRFLAENLTEIFWLQNTGMPADLQPFTDVEHDICVLFYNAEIHKECSIKKRLFNNGIDNTDKLKAKRQFILPEYNYLYNLSMDEQISGVRKKLSNFSFLKDVMQCHEGIHTGNIRQKLFVKNSRNKKSKPLFIGAKNGDKIDNYLSKRSGWYVIYDSKIINKSNKEYASLRDEYIFSKPKIYITRTGNPIKAFTDNNTYASNNFFSMQFLNMKENTLENLKVILAIINSKITNFIIREIIAPSLGNTFVETKITHLLKLPIPKNIDETIQKNIEKLVDKTLAVKKKDPKADTSKLEAKMDKMVYKLYDLTKEEIAIVEGKNECAKRS